MEQKNLPVVSPQRNVLELLSNTTSQRVEFVKANGWIDWTFQRFYCRNYYKIKKKKAQLRVSCTKQSHGQASCRYWSTGPSPMLKSEHFNRRHKAEPVACLGQLYWPSRFLPWREGPAYWATRTEGQKLHNSNSPWHFMNLY